MLVHLHANPKPLTPGFAVQFPYSREDVETIRQVLGFRWEKESKSWVSDGPEVLLDMERFGVKPSWLSNEARYKAEQFRQEVWNIINVRTKVIPDEEYAYQQLGTEYLLANSKAILGDDPGLGKSKQCLDAVAVLKPKHVLVLALNTLTYNWAEECKLWHPDISFGVVPDGPVLQKQFWQNPPTIVIANYEKLFTKRWPDNMEWDILICDEVQKCKNSNTQTWKAVRRISRRTERVWLVSGTPLEIRLMDLYNIFALARPSVLGVYPRFRDQHCELDWGGNVVKVKNLDLLRDRIGIWMLRRTKEEVLKNLPKKLPPVNHFVKMTVQEQKDYQELLTKFGKFLEDSDINVRDPLVQLLRMRQFCCTPAIWGINRRGSKYEALLDIVKNWTGKILIFSFFEEVTSLLAKWLEQDANYNPEAYISGAVKPKDRVAKVKDFNDGNLGNIFISTDAGQLGLNITGANLVIHYDQLWNPQKKKQREDRAHRIGQTQELTVINLMYMDSIDYGMYLLEKEREQLFKDVVDGAEEAIIKKLSPTRLMRIAEGKLNASGEELSRIDGTRSREEMEVVG